MRPIKKTRAYEQVVEQIKESIEKEKFLPGDRLPSEREMSEQLSISRSVIREAMSILQTSNIIDVRPGSGVFLKKNTKEQLLNKMNKVLIPGNLNLIALLEVRQGLEAQSAYLAAMRATETDIQEIHSALINLETAVADQKIAAIEDLDFHLAIGKASKNKVLIDLLNLISDSFLETLEETRSKLMEHNKVNVFINEHREIYNAIVAGEAEKARELMTLSIGNTIDFHQQLTVGKD